MKAMSVIPGRRGSELIADLPDPPPADGSVLAEGLLAGICGTDREVLDGAARRHYEQAVEALTRADPAWLSGLITRRVPLSWWQEVLTRQPGDVKVTVDLTK